MTVRGLIDLLGRYPDDMRVVVNGYEDGYDDLSPGQISVVHLALNTGVDEWQGRHGEADAGPADTPEHVTTADALVLRRVSN